MIMRYSAVFFLFFCLSLHPLKAQLTVADDNKVGIGVSSPVSKLSVHGNGDNYSTMFVENNSTSMAQRAAKFYKSASGTGSNPHSFGIISNIATNNGGYKLIAGYFFASNSYNATNTRNTGVYAIAGNGTPGYNYGVWARLARYRNGAALYATIDPYSDVNTGGTWAGYFRGDVYMEDNLEVHGLFIESDENIKKNIRLLKDEKSTQMEKLLTLEPIRYTLKTPLERGMIDKAVLDTMQTTPEYSGEKYTRDQIGLVAQELQKVYPELVKESQKGYLTVNYTGLVPILIQAIKEQEGKAADRDKLIAELQTVNEEQQFTLMQQSETDDSLYRIVRNQAALIADQETSIVNLNARVKEQGDIIAQQTQSLGSFQEELTTIREELDSVKKELEALKDASKTSFSGSK